MQVDLGSVIGCGLLLFLYTAVIALVAVAVGHTIGHAEGRLEEKENHERCLNDDE